MEADRYYNEYIRLYQYNPDEVHQIIYIFKRPFACIRLMAKLFKVSLDVYISYWNKYC